MKSWALVVTLLFTFHAQAQETCRGDREECLDLLNLPIEHYQWEHENSVAVQCGAVDVIGCAKIMADKDGLTRCVIHTIRYPRKELLMHEMNHCRGWQHRGDGKKAHARLWRKMRL